MKRKNMQSISIEIVPRSYESMQSELEILRNNFSQINTVNVPDLLRFEIRSYYSCRVVRKYYENFIPHIRAIDYDPDKIFRLKDYFIENNIKEMLIIQGDEPQGMGRKIYPTTSIELVRKIKKEMNDVRIYGCIDQYRNNIKGELDYIRIKNDAGFDGYFTQPFFDMRLFEIFAEKLENYNVYWGISPVTSQQSRLYWETKNKSTFPKNFRPDLDWNAEFARKILEIAKSNNLNVYLMPIKINIKEYLGSIF
jgi:methylenetetrahydrofolate reductase (NADPH)